MKFTRIILRLLLRLLRFDAYTFVPMEQHVATTKMIVVFVLIILGLFYSSGLHVFRLQFDGNNAV